MLALAPGPYPDSEVLLLLELEMYHKDLGRYWGPLLLAVNLPLLNPSSGSWF